MQTNNQRALAFILFISLFLQSCGVGFSPRQCQDEPFPTVQGEPVVSGVNTSATPPAISGPEVGSRAGRSTRTSSPQLEDIPMHQSHQQLREYIDNNELTSTQQLVDTFNGLECPEDPTLAPLHEWIRVYIDCFAAKPVEALDDEQLQEYAYLANIRPKTQADQRLLYRYFASLANKAHASLIGDRRLLEVLADVLQGMDINVFRGNTADLIAVGNSLLTKLDVTHGHTSLAKEHYPKYAALLSALHNILLLIHKIDPEGWSNTTNKALYDRFQDRIMAIEHRNPVSCTALGCLEAFEQTVKELEQYSSASRKRKWYQAQSSMTEPEPGPIAEATQACLGEDMLRKHALSSRAHVQNRLFAEVRRNLIAKLDQEMKAIPLSASKLRAVLQAYYRDNFEKMPPSLGVRQMPVDQMEFTLKLNPKIEAKQQAQPDPNVLDNQLDVRNKHCQKDKALIDWKDLFKPRRVKPNGPVQEINKVVLLGEAGTGKTSLTKKIAHAWSKPEPQWGQELKAVYVLPVRALRADRYDDNGHHCRDATLATAIANECFTGMREKNKFEALRERIADTLQHLTTLVILDGLDEQHVASQSILAEARTGTHKLLTTSRPYGIHETERARWGDIEVDNVGLDQERRDGFIHYAFENQADPNLAPGLVSFIKAQNLQEVASVPVNLKILCSLWEDEQDALGRSGVSIALPELYRKLVDSVWKRFESEARDPATPQRHARTDRDSAMQKSSLFQDLEKVALASLQQGKLIISRNSIEEILAPNPSPLLADAGFLLLQKLDQEYKFPHLTFQEYFAGRRLARQFLLGEQSIVSAKNFLKRYMYVSRYRRTLSFMAGELAKGMQRELGLTPTASISMEPIQKLLTMINDELPSELLGFQQLLLQLRLLNEWLLITEDSKRKAETLVVLEYHFHLGQNLINWFNKSLAEQVLRNTLQNLLLETSGVTKHYSNSLLNHIRKALREGQDLIRVSAVSSLPTLLEHGASLEHIFPHIQGAFGDSSVSVRIAAIQVLPIVLAKGGSSEQILSLLERAFGDNDHDVRRSAVYSLPLLLAHGGSLQQILSLMQRTLGGSSSSDMFGNIFRVSAVASLPLLLEHGASLEQIFPHMQKALEHGDSGVCLSAVLSLPLLLSHGASLEQILPHIQRALWNIDDYVRSSAIESLRLLLGYGGSFEQIFPHIREALWDSNASVRASAVASLPMCLEHGGSLKQIFPYIKNAFLADIDNYVRVSAVSSLPALLEHGESLEQILPLIQHGLEDFSPSDIFGDSVRVSAVASLSRLLEKGASLEQIFPHIQEALGDVDNAVRRAALQTLPLCLEHGGSLEQIAPHVQQALRDIDDDVRVSAIALLSLLPDKGVCLQHIFPHIQRALGDSSDDVRHAAVRELSLLLGKGASVEQIFPHVRKALEDGNNYVRRSAVQVIKKISIESLMNYYWHKKDQTAIFFLVPRLYEVALTIENKDRYQQTLVLYLGTEKPLKWVRNREEVQYFKELVHQSLLDKMLPAIPA
ncbi:MAG: NACHT domain-containing protein [Bacteroidota bacterium]